MTKLGYTVGDKVRRKKERHDDAWKRSIQRHGIPNLDSILTVQKIDTKYGSPDVYFVGYGGYWGAEYFELAVEKKYARELE